MPRKGENIYKRKDGRWEARYIKERTSDGKAVYGYVYANSYQEVKLKQQQCFMRIVEQAKYGHIPLLPIVALVASFIRAIS